MDTSRVALQLATCTDDPSVLAQLVPLAASSYYSSTMAPIRAKLLPADALHLIQTQPATALMVSALTDDPEVLAHLAGLCSTQNWPAEALTNLAEHPSLPLDALLGMQSRVATNRFGKRSDPSRQVIYQRLAGLVPDADLVQLVLSSGNEAAVEYLARHLDLAAPEALQLLEALSNPEAEIGWLYDSVLGSFASRQDLPQVFARATPGGAVSEDVLQSSVTALVELTDTDVRGPTAGPTARILFYLLEQPDLGLGAPVSGPLAQIFLKRLSTVEPLSQRKDLSPEAVSAVAFAAFVAFAATIRLHGVTDLDAVLYGTSESNLPLQVLWARSPLVTVISTLATQPGCPLDLVAKLPADASRADLLALLLPPEPRVWETAVHLLADEPAVSFGSLAVAAIAVS